jgi:hypothetical protein
MTLRELIRAQYLNGMDYMPVFYKARRMCALSDPLIITIRLNDN